jgi:GDP-4-dehydro-6-deoxy-D-mannose reductase
MKFLVTGAAGFIGSHLLDFLLDKGEVYGTYWKEDDLFRVKHLKGKVTLLECDIRDEKRVGEVVAEVKPDVVYHMAAQSFVTVSWKEPQRTLDTNIMGTFNLLEALRKQKQNARIIIACSSAEYGATKEDEIPLREEKELRPTTAYAVSKIGEDALAYFYWTAYGMDVIRARLFNITGPRKTMDACSDFTQGIVEVEKGRRKELRVGNTKAIRDITDVRDALNALWILTEKGEAGEAYNVCSGRRYVVSDIIETAKKLSAKKIKVLEDKTKYRKTDDPIFVGDNTKLAKLGWKPKIPIDKTLSDMLDYWRQILN